ncbi:MAG: metallophosphoesterase [Bacteroidota bacterium]
MKLKLLLFSCAAFALSACDMFEYHPYDGRIDGEKFVNVKNIERIEAATAGKTTIRFAFISDTQRWYNETEDCVNAINQRTDLDFVLHGGDVTDFGATKEFTWQRDILNGLSVPYVVLLGNHDCLANGEEIFKTVFGPINFSFLAGNTKFVCLNTNALEYDYSNPVPDFQFIENEIANTRPEYQKTVVAMHARPFSEQFNNNVANVFQDYITRLHNLQFCLNGHDHQLTMEEIFNDGIMYYGAPNIEKRQYYIFTITPDSYDYEVVEF